MSAAGIDIRTAAINVKPQIKILKENTRRPDRRAEKPGQDADYESAEAQDGSRAKQSH